MGEVVFVGTVKWFSSKGQPWGYINYVFEEKPLEIFVHYKALTTVGQENPNFKTLSTGQVVEFLIGSGHLFNKGTQALSVKVVGTVGTSGTN
jgi:cold shock CspA family protein